jgi:hypothetical protein
MTPADLLLEARAVRLGVTLPWAAPVDYALAAARLAWDRRRPGESAAAAFERQRGDEDVAALLRACTVASALSDPAGRAALASRLEPWQDAGDDLALARLLP